MISHAPARHVLSLPDHRDSAFNRSAQRKHGSLIGNYVSGEVVANGGHQRLAIDTPSLPFPAGKSPRWCDHERPTTAADYRDLKNGVIRSAISSEAI